MNWLKNLKLLIKVNYMNEIKNSIKELKTKINEIENKINNLNKKDYECTSEGIITKINNYNSLNKIYIIWSFEEIRFIHIKEPDKECIDFLMSIGFVATNKEVLEKKLFKMKIEAKLNNIADRLNNFVKIDWNDESQNKYSIYYWKETSLQIDENMLCKYQGVIYCLSEDFLDVAIQEIGEENLIKYFKE